MLPYEFNYFYTSAKINEESYGAQDKTELNLNICEYQGMFIKQVTVGFGSDSDE